MKLYIINQYYFPFHAATGQLLQELAEYLSDRGLEVTVVTGKNGDDSLVDEEIINDVSVLRLGNRRDGTETSTKFLSYVTFYRHLKKKLERIVENGSTVLVLSTPPLIGSVLIGLKRTKQLKILYNVQDLYPDILVALGKMSEKSLMFRFLKRKAATILEQSDKVIPIDSKMLELLNRNYGPLNGKAQIIENWALNGLEPDISTSRNSKLLVLYSGNMGRAHEYETLLRAIEELQHEKIKFEISGGGYNYNALKEKACSLNNVEFSGFVPREALSTLINRSDLGIVIGSRELSGIIVPSKFYGYIACGKPVIYISSGSDAISEHISRGKLGYCVANGDSNRLISILRRLARDRKAVDELENNVEKYRFRLSREKSLEKYFDLITD